MGIVTKHLKKVLSETNANTILDSVADGVFTVDDSMVITYFNRAAAKITGIPRDAAVGQFCFEVLRSNICEKSCPIRRSLKTGKDTIDRHKNILRSDGKQIPISLSASVLRDEKGNVIGGVETFRDLSTIEELKKEIKRTYTFEDIVSKNHRLLRLFDILPNIAESDSTVLIQGPSGSGKELFARALHNLSTRRNGPFIAINCGALPDTLLDSELFGYAKGAFTDAKKDKPGRFALANGGTIFLDEVESLSGATQVRLLRVLQEREFEPVGATSPVKADVRVIAATREELATLVQENKFRDDLYFRLNVIKLELPSLAARRDDIPLLVRHFVDKFNLKFGRSIAQVSDDVMQMLMQHNFPGNIRELENVIEHAFVMCRGEIIRPEHLPPEFTQSRRVASDGSNHNHTSLANIEREALLKVLERNNWNKVKTARELGLHRTSLWRKMKKYGLMLALPVWIPARLPHLFLKATF
jgi:PAS domain S-box-containing protein